MNLKYFWKASTKQVMILPSTYSTPAGYTLLGTSKHDEATDPLGFNGTEVPENHVLYHHVRDYLYNLGFTAMHEVQILVPTVVASVVARRVSNKSEADFSLVVGQTAQLEAVVLPDNATNKTVAWTSATPAKATISNTGLVTAVATGTSVITVTTADGSKTDTLTVTVTAS